MKKLIIALTVIFTLISNTAQAGWSDFLTGKKEVKKTSRVIWKTYSHIDEMTDDKVSSIYTQSLAIDYHSRRTVDLKLIIYCKNELVSIYVDWDAIIESKKTSATIRLDKNKAKIEKLTMHSDMQTMFFNKKNEFLKQLINSDILNVRVKTYLGKTLNAKFELKGLNNLVTNNEACKKQ